MNTVKETDNLQDINPTEELVTLIRGFFSLPVISAFGHTGVLKSIIKNPDNFTTDDFPQVPNKRLLQDAFYYLTGIGLLESAGEKQFKATTLGIQIFRRISSFYAPHSYRDYLEKFHERLLDDGPYQKGEVDRLENIIGSGRTHERYFPPAVSILKRKLDFDVMVDIGCGDGRFLEFVARGLPDKRMLGVDLSEISVAETLKNVRDKFPDREIETFCSDAADIDKWGKFVKEKAGGSQVAISMWFLLHEISRRSPQNVIDFLNAVHAEFPRTSIIVCELVRQSAELLTKNRKTMIMPEYVFFHDMSLQGVLSWKQYQDIFSKTPYKVSAQRLFDEIGDTPDSKEPATFVCCLSPE